MSASTVVSSALLASVVLDPGIDDPLQYCNGKHVAEALHREAGRRRDRFFKAERRDVRCQGGENHADAGFVLPACGGNAAAVQQAIDRDRPCSAEAQGDSMMRGLSFRWRDDACRQTSVCGRRVAAVTIVIGIAVAAPVVIEAVTPAWHDTETAAKTPVIETSVAFESSLATEIAVPPGKMRTRKPTAKSAAHFGATEMATTEMATTEMATTEMATTEMATTEMAATEMAATEAATVTSAATKTAPVTSATATAPVRKSADSQSAGESGNRSQDDHSLA
jgi:hypothetical protein